jgi:hypothetical protein
LAAIPDCSKKPLTPAQGSETPESLMGDRAWVSRLRWGCALTGVLCAFGCGRESKVASNDAGAAGRVDDAGLGGRTVAADGASGDGAGGTAGCGLQSCVGENCVPLAGVGECTNPMLLLGPDSLRSGLASREVSGHLDGEARACAARRENGDTELAFELDLTAATEVVQLSAELDADFDGRLRLEQGDCADPVLIASNDDHAAGVERAVIALDVEPGRYRLVAGPADAATSGEFRLVVGARSHDAVCSTTPVNDTCEGAHDLDSTLAVQTVLGSTRCGHHDAYSFFECHVHDFEPDVFYRLDLRARTRPVVLRVTTDLPPTNFATSLYVLASSQGRCTAPIDCSTYGPEGSLPDAAELLVELDPGEYFLVVDGESDSGEFGLRVSLDEVECSTNSTCDRPFTLEPAPGEQSVELNFACAESSRLQSCGSFRDEPDVFYHLDLSGFDEPVRVQAQVRSPAGGHVIALARGSADDACGTEIACGGEALDVTLAPDRYGIVVSAARGAYKLNELEVVIEPLASTDLKPCIDAELFDCVLEREDCCDPTTHGCLTTYSQCGLDPRLGACVCDAAPECCDLSGTVEACAPALSACGLFCPEFDVSVACEAEP